MANNDQPFKKAARKGWNNERDAREAIKKDTQEELKGEKASPLIGIERDELERKISQLKHEVTLAKREARTMKARYYIAHDQWWKSISKDWFKRGGEPETLAQMKERIEREWCEQIEAGNK